MNALKSNGSDQFYTFGADKFVSNSLDQPFLFSLTATLVWDRHVDFTISTDLSDESLGTVDKDLLSNLDLILQEQVLPGVWRDIYMSAGTLGNVEHIYLPELTGTDIYRLDVHATDLAEPATGETYALAASYSTVPEPGTWSMLVIGLIGISLSQWRRRATGTP